MEPRQRYPHLPREAPRREQGYADQPDPGGFLFCSLRSITNSRRAGLLNLRRPYPYPCSALAPSIALGLQPRRVAAGWPGNSQREGPQDLYQGSSYYWPRLRGTGVLACPGHRHAHFLSQADHTIELNAEALSTGSLLPVAGTHHAHAEKPTGRIGESFPEHGYGT